MQPLPRYFVVGSVVLALGCQASIDAQPASAPSEPKAAAGDPLGSKPSSQLAIGLRVAAGNTEGDGPSVSLVAVVHDADGQTSERNLGTFWGEVSLLAPEADRLLGVSIRGPKSEETISLVQRPGSIEARRRRSAEGGAGDTTDRADSLILKIPVPEGTKIRVTDPPLERDPSPAPKGN